MKSEQKARRQLRDGNVILAIKTLRDANGLPLGSAKDIVEGWIGESRAKAYAKRRDHPND